MYGGEGRREAKGKIRVRKGEGGTGREVVRGEEEEGEKSQVGCRLGGVSGI